MFRFSVSVLALGLACWWGDLAMAQACSRLQAELAHLEAQGGSGDRARYESAFREQAAVLSRTEQRARDAGCFGGFFFRNDQQRACQVLLPKLRDMQANLWKLDRLRRRGGRDNEGRIQQLQFMIALRGCHPSDAGDLRAAIEEREPRRDLAFSRGTYRTLCVRTCDGYYFPISFSTTRDRLPEDERTCQAMCPGAESKLFFHDNPGGGPENMTALDGEAYSSLPTAFQYRTSLAESCTCQSGAGYSVAAAGAAAGAEAEPATLPPRPRPAPGEDPETLANRLGDFVPEALADEPAATASVSSVNGRSVRVVGPPHWSTAEQDELILTPVPN